MRRRTYLAAATALTLGGCTGRGGPEKAEKDSDGDDPTPADADGSGTSDGNDAGNDGGNDVDDSAKSDDAGVSNDTKESDAAEDGGDSDLMEGADDEREGTNHSREGTDLRADDEGGDDERTDDGENATNEFGEDDHRETNESGREADRESNESADGEGSDGTNETEKDADPGEPVEPGTFDDFADLSRWKVMVGTLEATDRAYAGEQSAHLEAGFMEERVTIAYEFDEPRDFRGVVPGIAVASEEMVVPTIQLIDADGDRIDYRRAVKGGLPFMRYNFGVGEVFGNPDLGRVTALRITLWTDPSDERSFRCDDLHFTPRPEVGTVMIQFDDSHDTDYTEGFRILKEAGYPATTFVNPDRIGGEGWLSLDQLTELSAAGWTVGSHTLSHPNLAELDREDQRAEIVGAQEWLAERGFEGSRYFAYPFGGFDEHTVEIIEEIHGLGFAGGRPIQGHTVNPALCSRIGDPDGDRAVEVLDRTAGMRGITCLFYHRLEDDLLVDFEAMVERLAALESAGELEVISPRDIEAGLLFVE